MLGLRRRRWTNIKPALDVFAGLEENGADLENVNGVTLGQRLRRWPTMRRRRLCTTRQKFGRDFVSAYLSTRLMTNDKNGHSGCYRIWLPPGHGGQRKDGRTYTPENVQGMIQAYIILWEMFLLLRLAQWWQEPWYYMSINDPYSFSVKIKNKKGSTSLLTNLNSYCLLAKVDLQSKIVVTIHLKSKQLLRVVYAQQGTRFHMSGHVYRYINWLVTECE